MRLDLLQPRLLLVDDEPAVLDLLQTRLEIAGCTTFLARDGFEALRRLSEIKVEAMLLDINMPRLDGFGVLEHMHAGGVVRPVPTMVLTARHQMEDVRKAIGLGAKDYLAKPYKDEVLLVRVARLLKQAGRTV